MTIVKLSPARTPKLVEPVGQHVTTVRLYDQRPMLLPNPFQIGAQSSIDEARSENQQSPSPQILQFGPHNQPMN